MPDPQQPVGFSYDRFVLGAARIRWMHLAAFLAVALTFYARHASEYFTPCGKTCGVSGLIGSMLVWWPIALSWLVVRQFPTLAVSRGWQAAFFVTNLAVCVLYGWVSWHGYFPYLVSSAVHAMVLVLAAFLFYATTQRGT